MNALTIYVNIVNMSNMLNIPIETDSSKRTGIMTAAFTQFSQYGFEKTSMADIARATGMSRASLYTYFDNKEEIFRGACIHINAQSLADVAHALAAEEPTLSLTKKMENALLARYARLLDIAQSPHGSEIYNERNRLCGALAQDSVRDLRALLAKALKAADQVGEIELKPSGLSPAAAAEILQMAAAGLKAEAPDLKTYTKRLQGLVGLFFDGLARS